MIARKEGKINGRKREKEINEVVNRSIERRQTVQRGRKRKSHKSDG